MGCELSEPRDKRMGAGAKIKYLHTYVGTYLHYLQWALYIVLYAIVHTLHTYLHCSGGSVAAAQAHQPSSNVPVFPTGMPLPSTHVMIDH